MTSNEPFAQQTSPLRDLPTWLWLWFVPLMLLIVIIAQFVSPETVAALVSKEEGLVEHVTVVVLVPGIVVGFLCLRYRRWIGRTWLVAWIAAWTAAMIYFCGEEISWGQHYFGWKTPDALDNVNDQGEINLHNTTSWLDQKPRALVELWMIVGGLIVPIVRRVRPRQMDVQSADYWFWPTIVCSVAAGCMVASRIIHELVRNFDLEAIDRLGSSELREYYIALFLTLYMLSFLVRVRQLRPQEVASTDQE